MLSWQRSILHLKAFAKLQEGNTAFQNELDDKAIPAYQEVITELGG